MKSNKVFASWLVRYELSDAQAETVLGIHRNTVSNYRLHKTEVPPMMLYMLAALSAGLEPIPNPAIELPIETRLAMAAIQAGVDPMADYSVFGFGPMDARAKSLQVATHIRRVKAVRASHASTTRKPHPMKKATA